MSLKAGDRIKPNERMRNLMPTLNENMKDAHAAFKLASNAYRVARDAMLDAVKECHPELLGHDFVVRHQEDDNIIVLGERKFPWE